MTALRVLLVDDEPAMLVTLAANLELEGLEVDTALSGARALELIKQKSFDLVLSDVRMPKMNGVELFREIHKLQPKLPVILMTAFAMESLVDQAIREGAFTVLPKPFDVEAMLKTLLQAARRPTALIIDGERQEATAAVQALKAIGVNACAVCDEHSAIQTLSDETVDVCVIDLAMANSGTPPLLKRLRELSPSLSFIALAGHDVPALMQKIAADGPIAWMRRPLDACTLAQGISVARGRHVGRK
jgi:DNA-binding NtrC family response regulator